MGTKRGCGKKRKCRVCGDWFTRQGNRKTCSSNCSQTLDQIRHHPARERNKKARLLYEKTRTRDSDRRLLKDKPYIRIADYDAIVGPTARAHPASDKIGCLLVHRQVAYDYYGPGAHNCYWCGVDIEWLFGERVQRGKIVVDHLNGDGHDNRIENLVLSCFICNLNRKPCSVSSKARTDVL